jgi:hypothetical protein
VARRPHPPRHGAPRVPAPPRRHHPAAAPASRPVQRRVRTSEQAPSRAARARPLRPDATGRRRSLRAAPTISARGSDLARTPASVGRPPAPRVRRRCAPVPLRGRRSVIAIVTDFALAGALLASLGLATDPVTFAPARAPPRADLPWDEASWELPLRPGVVCPHPLDAHRSGRRDPHHQARSVTVRPPNRRRSLRRIDRGPSRS